MYVPSRFTITTTINYVDSYHFVKAKNSVLRKTKHIIYYFMQFLMESETVNAYIDYMSCIYIRIILKSKL